MIIKISNSTETQKDSSIILKSLFIDLKERGEWERETLMYFFIYLCIHWLIFVFNFFFREGKGGREGEKHQCVVASCMPPAGDLTCNPGICPRLRMEPATLWFTGQHLIHWATPARGLGFFPFFLMVDSCMCPNQGLNPPPWHVKMML